MKSIPISSIWNILYHMSVDNMNSKILVNGVDSSEDKSLHNSTQ